MSNNVVILGAGLAGLSTAFHLGNGCRIYEKENVPGGLARTDVVDGFIFDYDGHLLHFRSEYAAKLISRLLPDVFVRYKRNAVVFSHGVYTQYPFQANTFGLPPNVVKECIMGMAAGNKGGKTDNLHDWMLNNFGEGITRHFMYPYNRKFWTMPPEKLIPDWTQEYVPRVGLQDVVKGALTDETNPMGYNREFYYPRRGGISRIAAALAGSISGGLKTGYDVSGIDLKKKKVYFKKKRAVSFNTLVSTLPLVELRDLIVNAMPPAVKRAFSRLRYISIFNLNLGVARESISDKHWIYFPEDNVCFFRVGFPMNFSPAAAPRGASSLYAEVSYSPQRMFNKTTAEKRIRRDLIRAGILRADDKVLTRHIHDIRYAYVVYDHAYRESLAVINDFLAGSNVLPAGRFGRWKYMSMEDVLLDGKIVSEQIRKI